MTVNNPDIVVLAPRPEAVPGHVAWDAACWALSCAALALVVANYAALWSWIKLWAFAGHEYGFMVSAAAAWCLWRERTEIAAYAPQPSWRAMIVASLLGVAAWIGYVVDVRLVQLGVFIAGLAVLVWAILGQRALRTVAYPIALLVLALPIWNYFRPWLQDMTVQVTALALQVMGTPVLVDGTNLSTPEGSILVLSECSGAQYFQAGVTLGALHAFLAFRSAWLRGAVIACFALAAVVGNWIRVLLLVLAGELSVLQHFGVGWVTFAILILLAFLGTLRLQRFDTAASPALAPPPGERKSSLVTIAAAVTAALVIGPVLEQSIAASGPAPTRPLEAVAIQLPWTGPYVADQDWQPAFHGVDAQAMAEYRGEGAAVTLYRAYYAAQRQDREAINELNRVFDAEQWTPRGGDAGTHYRRVALDNGQSLSVIETRLVNRNTFTERLVWHWYDIAGEAVAAPLEAKLAQIGGVLRGQRSAHVIAISVATPDVVAGRRVLDDFLLANRAALSAAAAGMADGAIASGRTAR